MILNIFGNNHKKNALISYITTPFIKAHGFHTNHQESILIAQIFDYLGYNVYVVDYHTQEKIDYTDPQVLMFNNLILLGFNAAAMEKKQGLPFGPTMFSSTGATRQCDIIQISSQKDW